MATYVVSDLHGQYKLFKEGLEKIGFSEDDMLYVIGDVIDRGKDGIKLLQCIKRNKNMDLLIGNHEHMMLNSVDPDGKEACDGEDYDLWLFLNGGNVTYDHYLKLTEKSRKALLAWLRNRYVIKTLEVGGKKFCLTHSYYDPDLENKKCRELSYMETWRIVWKSLFREERATHGTDIYKDYDYTFIIGHVPVQRIRASYTAEEDFSRLEIYRQGNLIDIDGGCSFMGRNGIKSGALFLRLDDMEVFPVELVV